MDVHGLDLIIIVVFLGGVIRGVVTGHTQQILDLGAAFVAFAVALGMMHPISSLFAGFRTAPNDAEALVVSFCLIFVFGFSLLHALSRILTDSQAVEAEVPTLHRALGGAVGAILTLLLMSTAFTALGQVDRPSPSYRSGAWLYRPVAQCVPELWSAARQIGPLGALPAYFERRQPVTES